MRLTILAEDAACFGRSEIFEMDHGMLPSGRDCSHEFFNLFASNWGIQWGMWGWVIVDKSSGRRGSLAWRGVVDLASRRRWQSYCAPSSSIRAQQLQRGASGHDPWRRAEQLIEASNCLLDGEFRGMGIW